MKRKAYKFVYWFATKLNIERLSEWAYMKWLNTYADEPMGFWSFAGDFLDCNFTDNDLTITHSYGFSDDGSDIVS